MREKVIAKRYAEAFIAFSRQTSNIADTVEQFRALKRIIREHPEFQHFLENPEITFAEKSSFLETVLKENFSPDFIQFLKLLIDKRRIYLIVEIADYVRINYSHGEAVDAVLKTSYPLNPELIRAVEEKVEEKVHKKLNFYLELDGDLLGGAQVVIGNTVLDGSVRKRLEDLREKLRNIKV